MQSAERAVQLLGCDTEFLRNLRSSEAGNGIEHVIAIERFRQKITHLILQLDDVLTILGVANHLLVYYIIETADFCILFADKFLLLLNLQSLLLQQILLLLERSTENFFCMSDCLLIAFARLHRDITTRLANLWQHISRNPVLELHGSRKLRAENQSIETALVDEDHLTPAICYSSILLLASHYPYVVFHDTRVINMSLDGITLVLIPQHITEILCTELRFSVLIGQGTNLTEFRVFKHDSYCYLLIHFYFICIN